MTKVISLGLGVQSTVLYYLSSMGIIERADAAIFSDLGSESKSTYEYLKFLQEWQINNNGIQIIIMNRKNIYNDIMAKLESDKKFVFIPAFTKNKRGTSSILSRQCTRDYKVREVYQGIRQLQGLAKYKRHKPTEIWIGITADEASRQKDSPQKWATNVYPFLNYPKNFLGPDWKRSDCIEFLKQNNLPIPTKSSCVFCPYQSNIQWKEKMSDPDTRNIIVSVDNAIRHMSMKGEEEPIYLHKSLIPIDQIEFSDDSNDLFENDCEGHCGL